MDNPYWQKDLIWDFDDFHENGMFITKEKNDAVGIYANPNYINQKNDILKDTKILVVNDDIHTNSKFRLLILKSMI